MADMEREDWASLSSLAIPRLCLGDVSSPIGSDLVLTVLSLLAALDGLPNPGEDGEGTVRLCGRRPAENTELVPGPPAG